MGGMGGGRRRCMHFHLKRSSIGLVGDWSMLGEMCLMVVNGDGSC